MNFIAAFLLVFMEEENAFWTLRCIVEQLLPDYFSYDVLGNFDPATDLTLLYP